MAEYFLTAPLTNEDTEKLRIGDVVRLSGVIYTARDTAHKMLIADLENNIPAPFPLNGAVIYYVGASPTPEGRVIGSAGPTTASRMDAFATKLHDLGVKATIGKGRRNAAVKGSLKKNKAVYFGATGGAGALLSNAIKKNEVVAYEHLGPEAIYRLEIENFPLLVINDILEQELYVSFND